ncbi:hypothetical protein DFH06DRAFT_1352340 [Mycena polygramma]|nr:hypothetical protein DFH06DRAFT_1352340 [Mycena polygramma]
MEPTKPCGFPDGEYRCLPPWHPDSPTDKRADSGKKMYLATGPDLGEEAGAYNSWTSANRVVSGSRGATAPGFLRWSDLTAAWQVGCGRGEHDHPTDPQVQRRADGESRPARHHGSHRKASSSQPGSATLPSPLPKVLPHAPPSIAARTPGSTPDVAARTPNSTPAPRSTTAPRSTAPSSRSRTAPSSATASSLTAASSYSSSTLPIPSAGEIPEVLPPLHPRSYGIRWGAQGMVCGSPEDAEAVYRELEEQGAAPRMLTTVSFVDAACFAEGFSPALPRAEAELRAEWLASQPAQRQRERESANARRRRRIVAEAYSLRDQEQLARLRQRVVRLEAELAGQDWDGSSSFESLDSEALEREADGYGGHNTDDIVSEVEGRKESPKNWRMLAATCGGLLCRVEDELAHKHRR